MMNNELLLLIGKKTDTLIEQLKTKPPVTLEYKMNKQVETSSFSPPLNLVEEGKWLLGVSSFQANNSVLNITDENNSFSITTPSHWNSDDGEEFFNKLNSLLELRFENDIKLHLKNMKKEVLE